MSATAGETSAASATSTRTKEGVPTWNGEANSFVQYEETALLWEQSLTWEKRYTAGPKLVQELTGAAKRLVAGQPAGWVAYRGGVTTLMDHLRQQLGKPRVNEVTDLLAVYFKGCKRRSTESMNDYVTRKFEAYFRASQALQRVAPHYGGGGYAAGGDQRPGNASYDWESSYRTWARTSQPPTEPEEPSRRSSVSSDGSTEVPPSGAPTTTPSTWDDAAWRQWNSQWNSWSSWSGYGNWEWKSGQGGTATPRDWQMQGTDLLPPFIQGWYLLADAGLDHNEKNLVMTALGGDFNPQRVAQELRNQFPDGEVRRRDQTRRYQSYMGEFLEESEDDLDIPSNTTEALIEEGLTSEGVALVVDAESQAQEALAALHQARRTLKEARFKQHQVKQSRKYYHAGTSGKGSFLEEPEPAMTPTLTA